MSAPTGPADPPATRDGETASPGALPGFVPASDAQAPDHGAPAEERLAKDLDPALVESVGFVSRNADLLAVPVSSHRRVLGFLTRPLLRLARSLLVHVHHAQTVYNRRNADALEHLVEEHARIRADLEAGDRVRRLEGRALAARVEELSRRTAGLEAALEDLARRVPHLRPGEALPGFDLRAFADHVRGPEDAVRARQLRYVEVFRDAGPVLDAGCGRGEFLLLLRQSGIAGEGVDLDPAMVEACRERGLAVELGDLLETMEAAEDGRWGGVFCAQVVEHLPFQDLVAFLELAARKLRPGGVLVIETLNPESLFVHWRWFPMDPTHVRLVHPETLRFCLERSGFRDVAIDYLPVPEPGPVPLPPLAPPAAPRAGEGSAAPALEGEAGVRNAPAEGRRLEAFDRATAYLNERLYASTDYAAIARRA